MICRNRRYVPWWTLRESQNLSTGDERSPAKHPEEAHRGGRGLRKADTKSQLPQKGCRQRKRDVDSGQVRQSKLAKLPEDYLYWAHGQRSQSYASELVEAETNYNRLRSKRWGSGVQRFLSPERLRCANSYYSLILPTNINWEPTCLRPRFGPCSRGAYTLVKNDI